MNTEQIFATTIDVLMSVLEKASSKLVIEFNKQKSEDLITEAIIKCFINFVEDDYKKKM